MDIDFSWENPPEAQVAALEHAIKYAEPALRRTNRQLPEQEWAPPITEFHIAEMMCMAESSFWYSQACSWAEGKSYPARGADTVWQMAGRSIKQVVEHGYKNGKWWNPEDIWENPRIRATAVVSIIEVARMTRKLRGSLSINSAFFEVLPYLVEPRLKIEPILKALDGSEAEAALVLAEVLALYDPDFKKKLDATKKEVIGKIQKGYEPTECIHPECRNLVAPKGIKPREGHHHNYRGTGACQRGHNSYYCTRCKKPHSHDSKIGKAHYGQHYGGDFDAAMSEKWKAGEV